MKHTRSRRGAQSGHVWFGRGEIEYYNESLPVVLRGRRSALAWHLEMESQHMCIQQQQVQALAALAMGLCKALAEIQIKPAGQ